MLNSYKWIIGIALVSLLIGYLGFIHIASSPGWDTDYKYLYFSARQVLQHADIYHQRYFFAPSLKHAIEGVNLNPPLVAILMSPLGLMTYTTSFWMWSLLSLALEIFSVFLIVKKLFQPKENIIYFVSALLLLAYFPTFGNSYFAQTGALVFFLTTLGWLSYREKNTGLAGFFWGVAFSTKLFVGLFAWMLVWRKEWRGVKTFSLTTVTCGMINSLILGPDVYLKYTEVFRKVHWYSAGWNASSLGFFSRLFGGFNEKNGALLHFPQITPIIYSMVVILLLSTFVFFRKKSTANKNCHSEIIASDLAVAYTIIAMLLISPLAWVYYFSLLLIPCAVIFYWNQQVFHRQALNLFLAASLFFSTNPHLLSNPQKIFNGYDVFFWSGGYFYALCILAVLVFKMHRLLKPEILLTQHRSPEMEPSILTALFVSALLPSFFGILMIICFIMQMP